MSYEIKITRFELYPEEEPICYCVGFSGTAANSRSFYQDTQVSLEKAQGKSEEEIVALAWENIKDGFTFTMEALTIKSGVLGKAWDPEIKAVANESLD